MELYSMVLVGCLLLAAGVLNACARSHSSKQAAVGLVGLAVLANAVVVVATA